MLLLLLGSGCAKARADGAVPAAAVPGAVSAPSSATRPPTAETTVAAAAPRGPGGSPAEDDGFVPPRRGPGAALEPNLAKAPLVPRGEPIERYVASYYEALRSRDWARASKMVPPAEPGETPGDFERRQYGYEAGVANILSSGLNAGTGSATVVHITPRHGVWNVEWRFVETARGLAVRDLVYARPGGAGCH